MLNNTKKGEESKNNTPKDLKSAKSGSGNPGSADLNNKSKPTIFQAFTNFLSKNNEEIVSDPNFQEENSNIRIDIRDIDNME